jgi:hypothetical protein|uniref:Uncharacterized protein n=1 Tax=Fagus sylvatica TaxID=28930 RepID=A0A2N9G8N7_FAGSY
MIEDLFDDLLQQNWIALPEIKRPHEVGKVDDPKDCRFHRLISHPLKDCFVLKDKIQELLDNKVIVMSTPEEAATANPVSVTPEGFPQEMLKEESKGSKGEEIEEVFRG